MKRGSLEVMFQTPAIWKIYSLQTTTESILSKFGPCDFVKFTDFSISRTCPVKPNIFKSILLSVD